MTLDLTVGRTYRAKRPRNAGGMINDRTVVWVGRGSVQYDGPSIRIGRRCPVVPVEVFLAWADRDVTDELPKGEYAAWPNGGVK